MKYETVTLDFWDTIATYPFNDDIFMERVDHAFGILKKYDVSFDYSIKLMKRIYEHFEDLWHNQARTPTTPDMFRFIEGLAGFELDEEHFNELVEYNETLTTKKYFHIEEDIVRTLKDLSERYRLVIISDTGFEPGRIIKKAIEEKGLGNVFTGFVFSDETGFSKPDRRAFEMASDITCTPLEKMIHIGDRQDKDISGAKFSGMGTVLFTGFRDDDKDKTTADHIAESWQMIRDILF